MKTVSAINTQTAGYLVIFGLFIFLLGLIAYQTHPENAPPPLILGGGFGAFLILWGILGAKGSRWSRLAALSTVTLLSLACVWRASLGWLAVANGQAERAFASLVLTLMLVVSGVLLGLLVKGRRTGGTDKPAGPVR